MLKVAVIDSGINAMHSHVGSVAGEVSFLESGTADVLGHGTAVAAAIRERAAEVQIYSVRIFDRSFSTDIDRVVRALIWCAENQMDVVNLSLATVKSEHRRMLEPPCRSLSLLVAPYAFMGIAAYPGSLDGVLGVSPDPGCDRASYRHIAGTHFAASPFPRSLPEISPFENFSGPSFAVANFTGQLCRLMIDLGLTDREQILARLQDHGPSETGLT